jgi:hypothetical protein
MPSSTEPMNNISQTCPILHLHFDSRYQGGHMIRNKLSSFFTIKGPGSAVQGFFALKPPDPTLIAKTDRRSLLEKGTRGVCGLSA